jgi:hypothetical protein
VPEPRPEFHLHDDYSLTPAYVLGYAFCALGRIEASTRVRGRRGAIALLGELLATLAAFRLADGLSVAEPLRAEQGVLSRHAASSRVGPDSAARIRAALTAIEDAVRLELRTRGADIQPASPPGSPSLRVFLGHAALARCPQALRAELTDACRALDAHLYTASVFHLHRVWDQLPGRAATAADARGVIIADPRMDPAVQCSRSDAIGLLGALRTRLEQQSSSPA